MTKILYTVTAVTPSQTTQGAVDAVAEECHFGRVAGAIATADLGNSGPDTGTIAAHFTNPPPGLVPGCKLLATYAVVGGSPPAPASAVTT